MHTGIYLKTQDISASFSDIISINLFVKMMLHVTIKTLSDVPVYVLMKVEEVYVQLDSAFHYLNCVPEKTWWKPYW